MPVYHVVLFKLKPETSEAQVAEFAKAAKNLVGQIPGLTKMDVNGPLAATANRGQGFNMGLVAVLEKADDVVPYGAHPAHQVVHDLRQELCSDTLAYDLVFD